MFKGNIKFILIAIFLLIAFGILLLFLFGDPFSRPKSKIDLSRPSVIKEIQSLGNLETASYSIEKIVEAGQEGNVFQDILYGDRILLIAHGKVTAGVNLTEVNEDDVSVRGDELTINVPAPLILSSALDNSNTKVYDRSQGILNRGDKDLESEARSSAETSITQAACEAGILIEARENAIERLKQLFSFAGFTQVEIVIPQGNC